jgi:hypothetical protein
VIPHNKRFEGKVSGADFGLVLTVPVAFKASDTLKVRGMSAGCIIQAKRLISTGTKYKPIVFGRGFNHLFKYQRFALFLLYCFNRDSKDKPYAFEEISFVPCKDFKKETSISFKAAFKKFVTSATQQLARRMDVQDMVKGVFTQDFSTCEDSDIRKIIGLSHVPTIHIDISFPPDWEPPILEQTKVRQEQPISIER